MKQLIDAFNSGTVEQQTRRRNGIIAICITSVLLIVAALILSIGSIVMALSDEEPANEDPNEDGVAGYTTTTLDAATQLKAGDLLLLDEDHPYAGAAPTVTKFAEHKSRPKNEDGKNIYTIFGTDKLSGTEETVVAFHSMLEAFYEESKDDNLIVDKAYNNASGNQADEVYTAGTALSLSYYVNYTENPENVASIYEVEKYEWIYNNAHLYGFVQVSRAEGEENIFRYVGQPHATYMKKNNKTLSEYLTLLQDRTYKSPLKITAAGADEKSVSYSVYYVSAEETAYVPEHGEYTVSGDNVGGYIITVNNTAGKTK